jgi:hypothetical protein
VVLDDAVVHERDAAGPIGAAAGFAREVRVCVVHRRYAVRRPAGVRDAGPGVDLLLHHQRVELRHARGAARALELTVLMHGHPAGVVAAVLEALQPFDEDRDDVLGADGTDDSAHVEDLGCWGMARMLVAL